MPQAQFEPLLEDGTVKAVRNDETNVALQRLGSRNDRQQFELEPETPSE